MKLGFVGTSRVLEPEQIATLDNLLKRYKPTHINRYGSAVVDYCFSAIAANCKAETTVYCIDDGCKHLGMNSKVANFIICGTEVEAYSQIVKASDITLFPLYTYVHHKADPQHITMDFAIDNNKRFIIIQKDGKIVKK